MNKPIINDKEMFTVMVYYKGDNHWEHHLKMPGGISGCKEYKKFWTNSDKDKSPNPNRVFKIFKLVEVK